MQALQIGQCHWVKSIADSFVFLPTATVLNTFPPSKAMQDALPPSASVQSSEAPGPVWAPDGFPTEDDSAEPRW
jgi:hypothetical protein